MTKTTYYIKNIVTIIADEIKRSQWSNANNFTSFKTKDWDAFIQKTLTKFGFTKKLLLKDIINLKDPNTILPLSYFLIQAGSFLPIKELYTSLDDSFVISCTLTDRFFDLFDLFEKKNNKITFNSTYIPLITTKDNLNYFIEKKLLNPETLLPQLVKDFDFNISKLSKEFSNVSKSFYISIPSLTSLANSFYSKTKNNKEVDKLALKIINHSPFIATRDLDITLTQSDDEVGHSYLSKAIVSDDFLSGALLLSLEKILLKNILISQKQGYSLRHQITNISSNEFISSKIAYDVLVNKKEEFYSIFKHPVFFKAILLHQEDLITIAHSANIDTFKETTSRNKYFQALIDAQALHNQIPTTFNKIKAKKL